MFTTDAEMVLGGSSVKILERSLFHNPQHPSAWKQSSQEQEYDSQESHNMVDQQFLTERAGVSAEGNN